ncbi:MAG: uroporphyrinogen decarboxylase [Alphaproteobacteria bacterium]|nr:uroporphyrinogen decarboxylase [Alphaproteobacteria bacterium]
MKPLLCVLTTKEPLAIPPVWLMRQAGRYMPVYRALREKVGSFWGMAFNPAHAAEITLQPIRAFQMDAAILFSDILTIPHAMGCTVEFKAGEGPEVEKYVSGQTLLSAADQNFCETLEPVFEAMRETRRKLAAEKFDNVALIGFSGAPWTLACYMLCGNGHDKNFTAAQNFAKNHPQEFTALIDKLTDAVIWYLKEQIKAGAEAVQLFDSWAGIVPRESFNAYITTPAQKIVASLKAEFPEVPVIGFPRGAATNYEAYARTTKVDGLGVDESADITKLDVSCVLQGNLSPEVLLGDEAVQDKKIKEILEKMRGRPYIFNLGHGVIKETDEARVQRLVDTVRQKL